MTNTSLIMEISDFELKLFSAADIAKRYMRAIYQQFSG